MTDTENKVEEGTLPEGWEEGPLENFCEMYQPKTISKKDLIDDGPYPVYGANGQIGYYSEYNHQYSEVTVTCRGATCGTVNVIPAMSWITGNAMVVRPTGDSMTKSFLAKELESLDFSRIITGTAQPQITRATLSTSQVLVPPLSEQHQIVEILEEQLGRLDAALENVRVVKEKAAQFRRSLLHSAFNGTLTGHTPKEGTLPEGWEIRRLGELADLGPKVPSNLIETNSVLSFVPMKAVSEVSGRVDSSQTITAQEGKRRSLKYFANGDIIFAKITPCMENGKISIVRDLKNDIGFGSTEFHVIRLKNNEMSQKFYFHYLIQDEFRDIAKIQAELKKANILLRKTKEMIRFEQHMPHMVITWKDFNKKNLVRELWKAQHKIRVQTRAGHKIAPKPIVLQEGATVETVAKTIHKDMIRKFRFAKVRGPSAAFKDQQVGLEHVLKDTDIVEVFMK